jgi:cytochrome c oxidase assembly protein subunit 11
MTRAPDSPLQRRHRVIAAWLALVVVAMVGAAYAAVPLYRLFCQVTGFDGTPRIATRAPDPSEVLERTVTVRFDGNVAPGLPWSFGPVQNTMTVKIGESAMAYYKATNLSDRPVKGTATYNILPEVAAAYFNKIQCFCFTEQVLQPGETAEFPVSFFVDPQIMGDRDAKSVTHVTVSYTFHAVVEAPKPRVEPRVEPRAEPGVAEKRAGNAG